MAKHCLFDSKPSLAITYVWLAIEDAQSEMQQIQQRNTAEAQPESVDLAHCMEGRVTIPSTSQ